MRIVIATDAWAPQVNGVVRTLGQTVDELGRMGHLVTVIGPGEFRTVPCPTYPQIRLALRPGATIGERIDRAEPDALHVATEGPIGIAARRHALRTGRRFTTAFHTRFPEYVRARIGLPLSIGYAVMRRFHRPAARVMVPTPAVLNDLRNHGFDNVALWSRGVDVETFSPGASTVFDDLPRPIFLSVGRVAIEKNLEAFLSLDLPGSKVVIGDGPALERLRARFPEVRFLGEKAHAQLPPFYRAADVFVFPSRTDTFGLVLLEAMGCGLPVAAYPVQGPVDVVREGGVLSEDLREACLGALRLSRQAARANAERFTWAAATRQFATLLAPNPYRAVTRVK